MSSLQEENCLGQALCLMDQSFSWDASGDTGGRFVFPPCKADCLSVLLGLIIKLAKREVLFKGHQERAPSLADARSSLCPHLGERPMAEMTSRFAHPDPCPLPLPHGLLILGKAWLLSVSGEQNPHIPI